MDIEEHLYYTKEHEWINIEDNIGTIGITDYAQSALGDVTFVELPTVDDEIEQFGSLASVESVKAASDIYSPMTGKIVEVNDDLTEDPGLINKSCYEKGWLAKIEIADDEETSNLMTAEEYRSYLESCE